jgi:hypothetical protein
VPGIDLDEPKPTVETDEPPSTPYSVIDARLADGLFGLRLSGHDATIAAAARAVVDLRMDRMATFLDGGEIDEPIATDS